MNSRDLVEKDKQSGQTPDFHFPFSSNYPLNLEGITIPSSKNTSFPAPFTLDQMGVSVPVPGLFVVNGPVTEQTSKKQLSSKNNHKATNPKKRRFNKKEFKPNEQLTLTENSSDKNMVDAHYSQANQNLSANLKAAYERIAYLENIVKTLQNENLQLQSHIKNSFTQVVASITSDSVAPEVTPGSDLSEQTEKKGGFVVVGQRIELPSLRSAPKATFQYASGLPQVEPLQPNPTFLDLTKPTL